MSIPVLYCDQNLLVCEKPVGVSCESPGIPEMISMQCGFRVWPVHRLDYGTGGVLILARSTGICSEMQKMFIQNKIHKEYLSVISGEISEPSGRFEDLLFHDRHKNKSYIADRNRAGVKKAVCEWEKLGTVFLNNQPITLVRIVLHTGRTHQIRVQFGSRGFPLVGDGKYGSRIKAETPAIWAHRISFPHPADQGKTVSALSQPPLCFPWNQFEINQL